jgi:putative salt-induced outer membrane protein
MTTSISTLSRAGLLCALIVGGAQAFAADGPDGLWHGNVALGGAFASGNTNSKTLSGSADGSRATAADKISLFGNVNYGRNKVDDVEKTTADQVRAGGRYDYNLSADTFVFGGGDGETNKAAGLDSRFDLDTGLGYKIIHDAINTFDVYGGVGYSRAKFVDGTTGKGATAVLGEESSHKLSESTTFKQKIEFHPGAHDIGNLATLDAGLATAIAGGWTLNTGLNVHYASKVPAGLKKTDSLLTVGFGYKF